MNEENQRRRTRRRERPVKKKKGRILAICLAALVLAGAVYGVHTWADYSGSFQSSAEVTVKIPSGSSGDRSPLSWLKTASSAIRRYSIIICV